MKKILVFDIDDTLTCFKELYLYKAIEFDQSLRNTGIVDDSAWVSKKFDWSQDEIIEFKKKYRSYVHTHARIKKDAREVLLKLKPAYEIWFLSSRTKENFDAGYDETIKFFVKRNIPFDKLIIDTNKGKYLADKKIEFFVDNDLKNCIDVASQNNQIKIIVFGEKCQNANDNFYKANNWLEIEKIINNN